MVRGFSISDYRSIGEEQRIWPLGKINLFVGPNNSGKSNILRFVNENLRSLVETVRGNKRDFASHPHIRRGKGTSARLCVEASYQALQNILAPNGDQGLLAAIHKSLATNDLIWVDSQFPDGKMIEDATSWGYDHFWRDMWARTTNQSGGGLQQHWIPETLRLIKKLAPAPKDIYAIPVDRQAGHETEAEPKNPTARILGGQGVILALAAMQNPEHAAFEEGRKRFDAIQEFVRTVTDDASANISVTHKQTEILVQLKGQAYLPLAALGSGIEQVVLHAVSATSATDAIVTFEEPELHLHPVLQRQLMTYLAKTSNQYFISTHSAHLIDALHSDTFHVRLVDGQTVVEKASTDAQRHKVCTDLGYRPSDLVQANCVIWVEGPSDRVYLRHWLTLVDPHLSEQVHFSIMFYGGKLLSHLSAGETDTVDDGLEDVIHLRLLNRQMALIMDSDLDAADGQLRATKVRVADEIKRHGGFVWITAGREIENYIPSKTLSAAVEAVAPGRGEAVRAGQYEKVLPSAKPNSKNSVDKMATALKVEETGCDLGELDLRENIEKLSSFIRAANGLAPRV